MRQFPERFDQAMQGRGEQAMGFIILELGDNLRAKISELQDYQSQKNILNQQFTDKKLSAANKEEIVLESKRLEEKIQQLKTIVHAKEEKLEAILLNIPNIPAKDVPIGQDETSNQEISRWGSPRDFNFAPKSHDIIGENLNILDFKQTAKFSGARFSTFKGKLARLARGLINFMLDHNIEHGYIEHVTPQLVLEGAMYRAGQLPKFAQDSFKVEDKFRLIPTSEVTLVNLVADSLLKEEELPLKFTAYSECFRSEAGSAGRDTKGIIRQHQFGKVELVSIVAPENSTQELENMVEIAECLLKKLELPYRKMLLCTGDMGFCAQKTYDLEVWLPSQNCYREISSCSNCGSFQARRLKARYKTITASMQASSNRLVHTLNGSSLPIGRTIVAIMENFQNADGSITIPEILRNYIGFDSIDLTD